MCPTSPAKGSESARCAYMEFNRRSWLFLSHPNLTVPKVGLTHSKSKLMELCPGPFFSHFWCRQALCSPVDFFPGLRREKIFPTENVVLQRWGLNKWLFTCLQVARCLQRTLHGVQVALLEFINVPPSSWCDPRKQSDWKFFPSFTVDLCFL